MNAHTRPESSLVESLLSRHGQTYSDELGIDVAANTSRTLFRLFSAAILIDTNVQHHTALAAAAALADHGWDTAERLATCHREDLRRALASAGCVQDRGDIANALKSSTHTLLETYRGDLRALRDRAGYDPASERTLLTAFGGIGKHGANFFFREVQPAWEEVYPFAGGKASAAARRLGLPDTAEGLAALVPSATFARLVAALVRSEIAHRERSRVAIHLP